MKAIGRDRSLFKRFIMIKSLASKGFPYIHYLISTFPFFALLISNNAISPEWSVLLLLLPLAFVNMAGFVHNELCDSSVDPPDKNMITAGLVSKNDAMSLIILSISFAILSAFLIYGSPMSIVMFCVHMFFWLAYNGLKIRFKSTFLGPFVAGYVLWVAPSLVLLTEFSFWNNSVAFLLLGLFVVFSGHELLHQIRDYPLDLGKTRTLAVRLKISNSVIMFITLLVFGSILLLYGMYLSTQILYFTLLAIFISFFILYVIEKIYVKSLLMSIHIAVKIALIAYGCITLELPLLLTLVILSVFLAESRFPYFVGTKIPRDE